MTRAATQPFRKFLFVSHDTSRTGAPMVLLYFLHWLKVHHREIETTVLVLEGGSLAEDFKESATKFYDLSTIQRKEETFLQDIRKRILRKFNRYPAKPHPQEFFIKDLANRKFDIIYANSVASAPIALKIKKLFTPAKFIVHVHELNSIISLKAPNFEKYTSEIDTIIAASYLVKENLLKNYGCEDRKILVLYEFAKEPEDKRFLKNEKFLVGGAGTVHWRKGSDLFIQVAYQVKKKFPDLEIKFEWIGHISNEQRIIFEADLAKMGLENMVSFVGPLDNPNEHFNSFDLLLLPSREDPFPLVAIELGMLGKPIICFEKATGTAEVLSGGGGFIVPYMDVEEMAEKIMFYYKNKDCLKKDGQKAKEIFSEFTPEKICPHLFENIKSLL